MISLPTFHIVQWFEYFKQTRNELLQKKTTLQKHKLIPIVLDHIFGIVFAVILLSTNSLSTIKESFFKLDELLEWCINGFVQYPGMFKFNINYNNILSTIALFIISLWKKILTYTNFVSTIYLFGITILSCCCGITSFISFFVDYLTIVFVPIECLIIFFKELFKIHVNILISLLRLFVGKKYNPLRKTVDVIEYKQDIFVLGTILFALLIILFPCTGIYSLLFFIVKVTVTAIKRMLKCVAFVIVEFPVNEIERMFHHEYFKNGIDISSVDFKNVNENDTKIMQMNQKEKGNEEKKEQENKKKFESCSYNYKIIFGKTFYFPHDLFADFILSIKSILREESAQLFLKN